MFLVKNQPIALVENSPILLQTVSKCGPFQTYGCCVCLQNSFFSQYMAVISNLQFTGQVYLFVEDVYIRSGYLRVKFSIVC